MNVLQRASMTLVFLALAQVAQAAGKLGVEDAWIRVAPPGAGMLAGYATLKNSGDAPISVLATQSDVFRSTSVHESRIDKGVSKMRKLDRLEVLPGTEVKLAPGSKHLMLMQPRREIVAGERIEIVFLLADGTRVPALFDVLPVDAAGGETHHH
jgi:copper(I)-binding protein